MPSDCISPLIFDLPLVTVTDFSVPLDAATVIGFTGETSLVPCAGVTVRVTGAADGSVADSATGSTQFVVAAPSLPALLREEHPAAVAAAATPSVPMMTLRR
ncbi:hypothetical protein GCM10023107_85830 [Actinoplanes octamycinicus]|nr:hypothetical protein Aoc01nite_72230 [Actinoplanes octamycinicus]